MKTQNNPTPLDRLKKFMQTHGFKTAVWDGWDGSDCPELTMYYGDPTGEPFGASEFKIGSPTYIDWIRIEAALEKGQYPKFTETI